MAKPTKMPKKMRDTLARIRGQRAEREAEARRARQRPTTATGTAGFSRVGAAVLGMALLSARR